MYNWICILFQVELFWPLLLTSDFFGHLAEWDFWAQKKSASVLPEGFLRNLPSSLASWQSNQFSRVVVERERERATHHETKYVSKWVVMYIILQVYRVKMCSFLLIESHCTYIRKWQSSHPTSNRECVFFGAFFWQHTGDTCRMDSHHRVDCCNLGDVTKLPRNPVVKKL